MKKSKLIFFVLALALSELIINIGYQSVNANTNNATKAYQKKLDKLNLEDKSISDAKKSIKKSWSLKQAKIKVVDSSNKDISKNKGIGNKQTISSTFTLNNKHKVSMITLKSNGEEYKSLKTRRKEELKSLNKWYKNDYSNEQRDLYSKDGKDYYSTNYIVKETVLAGFTVKNGNLMTQISKNQLSSENLKQKDIANFGMNVVLPNYKGNLSIFKNANSDGSLKDDVLTNPLKYAALVN